MDKLFGELRALLAQNLDKSRMPELTELLKRAWAMDTLRFDDQWKPYLSSFQLPWLRVYSVNMWQSHLSYYPESTPVYLDLSTRSNSTIKSLRIRLLKMPMASIAAMSLDRWTVGELGMKYLVEQDLSGLVRLSVDSSSIGDAGLKAWVQSPYFHNTRHLSLNQAGITPVGIKALCYAEGLPGLEVLCLDGNKLTQRGAKIIANSPDMKALSILHMSDTKLDNAGVGLLCASPHLAQVHTLHVASNRLSYDAIRDLGNASFTHQLQVLDLSDNRLTDQAILRLFEIQFESLRKLDLSGNNDVTSAMLNSMLTSSWFGRLESLNLTDLGVGDLFVEYIAHHDKPLSLKLLLLGESNLSDRHANLLANCTCLPHLEHLSLQRNQISTKAARALTKSQVLPAGLKIELANNPCTYQDWIYSVVIGEHV